MIQALQSGTNRVVDAMNVSIKKQKKRLKILTIHENN
jgi:hypothetical protein